MVARRITQVCPAGKIHEYKVGLVPVQFACQPSTGCKHLSILVYIPTAAWATSPRPIQPASFHSHTLAPAEPASLSLKQCGTIIFNAYKPIDLFRLPSSGISYHMDKGLASSQTNMPYLHTHDIVQSTDTVQGTYDSLQSSCSDYRLTSIP